MSSTVVTEGVFGKTSSGEVVKSFTLSNSKCNIEVKIISYGAALQSICVPDKYGKIRDICLGFDDVKGYEAIPDGNPYMGAICGRVANRIGNAKFSHRGTEFKLTTNEGINHLHGGHHNWSMVVWKGKVIGDTVVLSHESPDGDQGYPGNVNAHVTYQVTDKGELIISHKASADKVTPIDMTSHGYFNLAGEDSGSVDDHLVTINADHVLEVCEEKPMFLIPTGKVQKVDNTPFDLRKETVLGDVMSSLSMGGYMHNFCLNGPTGKRKAARVKHTGSGIVMDLYTDQQGLMFYTSDYVNVPNGKSGHQYLKHSAFCMETQGFVDAVNHDNFPDPFLYPESEYQQTVWHKFSTE